MAREPLSILVFNHAWLVEELRSFGHKVLSVGWSSRELDIRYESPAVPIEKILKMLPRTFVPDCLLYLDDSGPVAALDLEHAPFPTMFYSIDAHHHMHWHKHFGRLFDKVLVAQKDLVPEMQSYNSSAEWFPLWASEHLEPVEPKSIDVCFRGTLDRKLHPERAAFFERLSQLVPVDALSAPFRDAFPRSRIVVNQAVRKDVNFRVFETLMCGALLVTPEIENGLKDLFTPGRHLVTYRDGDAEDAAEKIKYYLDHEEERAAIAKSGRDEILAKHTAYHRARRVEELLYDLTVSPREGRLGSSALTVFYTSRTLRKISDAIGDALIKIAAQKILQAIESHEPAENDFYLTTHLCKYELLRRGLGDEAARMMRAVAESRQGEPLLRASYLETLELAQKHAEAVEEAKQFSTDGEVAVLEAVEAFRAMRDEIMAQLVREPER